MRMKSDIRVTVKYSIIYDLAFPQLLQKFASESAKGVPQLLQKPTAVDWGRTGCTTFAEVCCVLDSECLFAEGLP